MKAIFTVIIMLVVASATFAVELKRKEIICSHPNYYVGFLNTVRASSPRGMKLRQLRYYLSKNDKRIKAGRDPIAAYHRGLYLYLVENKDVKERMILHYLDEKTLDIVGMVVYDYVPGGDRQCRRVRYYEFYRSAIRGCDVKIKLLIDLFQEEALGRKPFRDQLAEEKANGR